MNFNSIAISGLPGSGKSSICKSLTKRLNWNYHSIGDAWRQRWSELYPEQQISFEKYWKNTPSSEQKLVNLQATKLLQKGNLVLDSRYSSMNSKGIASCLTVFIKAPLEIRAQRSLNTIKYPGKFLKEIKQILLERESDELHWGKKLFSEKYDYQDPGHYRLVLDTEKLSIKEEIEIINGVLKQ